MKRVLAPGGALAFDSRDPDCRGWEKWEGGSSGELPGHGPFESKAVTTRVAGDVVTFEVDTRLPDGERRRGVSDYRFRSRLQLTESMERAGFAVETVHGGWNGEAVGEGCGEIVIVATTPQGNVLPPGDDVEPPLTSESVSRPSEAAR